MQTITDSRRFFGGIFPRISPHNLDSKASQEAFNLEIRHTTLKPSFKNRDIGLAVPEGTKTLFQKESGEWIFFDGKAYIESTPYSEDIHDRTFINYNCKTYQEIANGVQYKLGVQKPVDPLILVAVEANNDATLTIERAFEKTDGTIIVRETIYPTEINEGSLWQVVIPPPPSEPDPLDSLAPFIGIEGNWIFIVTGEQDGAGLGTAYTSNSNKFTSSDLFVNSKKCNAVISGVNLSLSCGNDSIESVDELRFYVYTLVNDLAQESGFSPVSEEIYVKAGESIDITIPQTFDTEGIELIRIYRSDSSGQYKLVKELPVNAVNTNDNSILRFLPNAPLGIEKWDDVPSCLGSLVMMPSQYLVGHEGRTIYVTQQGDFHAWRLDLGLNTRHNIKAISPVYENMIYIFTEEEIYIGTGLNHESFSITKVEASHPLVSVFGIADAGKHGIAFCSSDGLHLARGSNIQLITRSRFTKRQWRELNPENMHLAYANEILLLSTDVGTYLFWLEEGDSFMLTQDSEFYSSSHADARNDELIVVNNGSAYAYRSSDIPNKLRWKSPVFFNHRKFDWKSLRIQTYEENKKVKFSLFADDVLVWERDVMTNREIKIPYFVKSRRFHYQLESHFEIIEVILSTSYLRV